MCDHEKIGARLEITHLREGESRSSVLVGLTASLQLVCPACGMKFSFSGMETKLSMDGLEILIHAEPSVLHPGSEPPTLEHVEVAGSG